jgi:hypothetical protein
VNFGAPAVLWALPLVAVPVIIHLIQRRRYQRVDFAAMEFLRRAIKRLRRRVLLEDILLLVLRTLAVLVAILALAQPGTQQAPAWLGRSARTEILILDASLSMNHRSADNSAYERAVGLAERQLSESGAAHGARAAVIRAGIRAERLAAGDPIAARAALRQASAAGFGRADFAGAFETALRTAEDLGTGAPPRVTVFSDLQATAWNLATENLPALARLAQAGIPVEIVNVGAATRNNVALVALGVPGSRWIAGETVDVLAQIRNFGADAIEVRAECLLDGDPVATETLRLGPGVATDWIVALLPAQPGVRAAEIRLAHDALAEDDARAVSFEVADALDVMLVGEPTSRDHAPGVYDALFHYVDLGEGAPLRPRWVLPAALEPRTLAEVEIVVLADPGELGAVAGEALSAFLARGGGVLIALGPRTGEDELATLRQALGRGEVAIEASRRAENPFARLTIRDENHPALRFFLEPRWRPLLTEIPFREWRPLRVAEDAAARVVLAFQSEEGLADEGAALVEERYGAGVVAWLAAAPHSTWNRMEEVPGATLALVYDLLFHLAPAAGFAPSTEVGEPLAITLPGTPSEILLRDPEGVRVGTQAAIAATEGSSLTRATLLPLTERPGVWRAEAHMIEEDGSERRVDLRLAVGTPPAESDLRPANLDVLRGLLPPGVTLRDAQDTSPDHGDTSTARADYALLFWKIVLGLLAAETLLAALLDRRRR